MTKSNGAALAIPAEPASGIIETLRRCTACRRKFTPADDAVRCPGCIRRNRRARDTRARTLKVREITKRSLQVGLVMYPDKGRQLPMTRADCVDGPRPCPYVSCKHNMFLDVGPESGSVKLNFPDREPEDMRPEQSCVLDMAETEMLLEDVAAVMNMTRERVRQIEEKALAKSRVASRKRGLTGLTFDNADGNGAVGDPDES